MSKKRKKGQKGEASFVKKYGLEGKGKPVQISEKTKIIVRALATSSEAAIKAGKATAVLDNTRYK
jgi:hypothetical protein